MTEAAQAVLRSLIERLIGHATDLQGALESESDALAAADFQRIADAASHKDSITRALEHTQRSLEASLSGRSLRDTIAAASPSVHAELEPLHTLLKDRLDQCRHRNAVNGKVVHRSRQSIAELSRILTGTHAAPTYTATGRQHSSHDGHPLAHA